MVGQLCDSHAKWVRVGKPTEVGFQFFLQDHNKKCQNVFFQNIIHLVPKKLIMGTKKMGTLNGHSATLCCEFYMNVHRLTTHHKK